MWKDNNGQDMIGKRSDLQSRLVSILILIMLIMGLVGYNAKEANAASVKLTSVKALKAGSATEHVGKVTGLSGYSYCIDTGKLYPKKGTVGTLTKIKASSPAKSRNVAKLLYYYAHLQSAKYSKTGSNVRILRLAMHLAYHNGDKWTKWPNSSGVTSKESKAAHKIYNDAKSKAFPKDTHFSAYIFSPKNTNLYYQRLATFNVIPIKPGEAELVKELSEDGLRDEEGNLKGSAQGFKFEFRNTKDSKIVYTGSTDKDGRLEVKGMKPGKYTVNEILTDEQKQSYESLGGDKEVEIKENEVSALTWTNRFRPLVGLSVIKQVDDAGSVAGFKFKVKGRLFNNLSLTEDELIRRCEPDIEYDEEKYISEEWKVDTKDLEALNSAAKNGETGEFTVKFTNIIKPIVNDTPEGDAPLEGGEENQAANPSNNNDSESGGDSNAEDKPKDDSQAEASQSEETQPEETEATREEKKISITTQINLKTNDKDETESEAERTSHKAGEYTVHINKIDFLGAAGVFEEEFETDETGQKVFTNLEAGEYTVTEVMSEEQAKRYKKPEPQTIKLTDTNREAVLTFENKAKRTPVMLEKEYPGQNLKDIEFRLTGKTDFGVDLEMTKKTDEKGIIDFGSLYAGRYRIEEIGFDPSNMLNMYKLDGSDLPGFDFVITGEEKGTLWLGGSKNEGGAWEDKKTFLNEDIPIIETTLLDRATEKHSMTVSENTVLYDTVRMKNLIPGEEYTLTGRLVDREKGKPTADKGREILNDIKFTPKSSEESLEIEFKFDSSSLNTEAVVAYEELSKDGEVVAVHADINNKEQTVEFTDAKVRKPSPQTGDRIPKLPFVGLTLAVISFITVVEMKRKRR